MSAESASQLLSAKIEHTREGKKSAQENQRLSEISGQYFLPGFKPRDRIFPAVSKESSILSCHRLKV